MVQQQTFEKGQTYRDTSDPSNENDQFLRWFFIEKGHGLPNSRGVRWLKYGKEWKDSPVPSAIVLISNPVQSKFPNPWEDTIDLEQGVIGYWGDNKSPSREPLSCPGNKMLDKLDRHIRETESSEFTPPVLHFTKETSGKLVFDGLCAVEAIRHREMETPEGPVQNIHVDLKILPTAAVSAVWLRNRALNGPIADTDALAPQEWQEFRGLESCLPDPVSVVENETKDSYSVDDAASDVFVSEDRFREFLRLLRRKKNLVLQGPPGVGKTFLAKRLAFAHVQQKPSQRVEMVQFHQSYSYEDFIQGFRPSVTGGFRLENGVFYEFCRQASETPDQDYCFLIDEINRANLSSVLGEIMMLIEPDKRGAEFSIPLTYSQTNSDRFFVPENVCVIGMMNTADRSLAFVDYALRRRFIFFDVEPAFDTPRFQQFLENRVTPETVSLISSRMQRLNETIREDQNLGRGFEIGHSYFCERLGDQPASKDWYTDVVNSEIAPLIREYWWDDRSQANRLIEELLR